MFDSSEWLDTPESDRKLIVIGKKALDAANSRQIPVEKSFIKLSENISELSALEIVSELISVYLDSSCKEVKLIAPHYKNSFTFYPVIKTFLPFSLYQDHR